MKLPKAVYVAAERCFRKAPVDPVPDWITIRPITPPGLSTEDDAYVRLDFNNSNSMESHSEIMQAIVPEEMNLVNIGRLPKLLTTFQLTPASSGNVFSLIASPCYSPPFAPGKKHLGNCQVISRWAQYWRGSMKYMFSFTCS